ncbi:MAG: hypothetical protein WBF33_24615, partial [Candidatus Nitrosopolaris sp.]
LRQPFKLFVVMKYDRHKNWLYANWFSRIRGSRQVSNRISFCLCPVNFEMISILFLLINLLSEMNCSTHLTKSSSFVLLVQRLIQRKEESTFFTHIAQPIEIRA